MRNLRNVRFGRCAHQDITASCWDPETDQLICTVGPTASSPTIELIRILSQGEEISSKPVSQWDAPSPNPDLDVDRVVGLQYMSGLGLTCIVLEGGDIITVQEDAFSGSGAQIEIVGSIDAGISAARWSPDEELLVITTKADAVIFMGSSFDPVAEVTLSPEDLKASKHVSVGWGKKETQFQGRGAKALRDPTIPEKVDQGVPSSLEDGATTISWRGDGAYVAINSAQASGRRVVRIFSRDGELDSATEPVDGLETALSWRPEGNLMACGQRLEDRVDVVFFERNGLRHGQFTLREPESGQLQLAKVALEWNSDSTVLAVMVGGEVQLWTMGNYHWYLKKVVTVDHSTSVPPQLSWHPEKALHFAVASTSGVALAEEILHTTRGTCLPPYDIGAVAVIDGTTVKLTPFRTANVPPPMSLFDVTTDSPVADVAFGRNNTSLAVLHAKGVNIYDWSLKEGRSIRPTLRQAVPLTTNVSLPLRIVCTSDGNWLCAVYRERDADLVHIIVKDGVASAGELPNQPHIVSMSTYEDATSLESYGQDIRGSLFRLLDGGSEGLSIQFPTHLPWFEIAKAGDRVVAFGLSRNGHMYANTKLLAKNCTSFVVTPSHLIITSSNHLVKFIHLASDVEELEVPADNPETDERCRSVERGSRLVAAIPTNMSLVLQMPRGNVETIFPRAMVVAGIRSLIEEKNYSRAFSYCRTQRVDMNILYDHRPAQFLASVGQFLDQLNNVAYIDLFLSSLKEEDVTETMYKDTKKPRHAHSSVAEPQAKQTVSKVNTVCDSILKELQARKTTNLQNVITAHVCKSPPALDDGLALVAGLMQDDDKVAERAVEHICFLVDVNRLYEHALGLYNLELALLVAQQSQRDPREYVPFIQDLHQLPELRRKFAIDDHLSRRSKALLHLQTLDAFDELCTYTTKYALYQEALGLYRYDQPRHRAIMALYAEYLESKSSNREAGLAYESLGNYAKATSCYLASGATCWQECLCVAKQQTPSLSADALGDLATNLADALWEAKEYSAAATIHAEHLQSPEMAVRCLCKGYHFAEAMRLVVQQSRMDLLATAVDTGLADALGNTTEFLADCKGQLGAQVPRISELRRKAIEDPLSFYEGERPGGVDIPDDVSIAASSRISTSASLFTRYTGKDGSVGTVGTGVSRATSKNRRREEKKRARGRKGTVYEEEYLVNSVRRLVERVAATKPDVERLVFALVRRGMAERARAAEALMSDVINACQVAVSDVFAPAAPNLVITQANTNDASAFAWRASGGDGVLQDWMEGQAKPQEPPVMASLSRLALLG